MANYPIEVSQDGDGDFVVSCQKLPEVAASAANREAALSAAERAVIKTLAARMTADEDIPAWSSWARVGQDVVELHATVALKVTLQRAMKHRGISRGELARQLEWHRPQVDRLFALDHGSRLDQIGAALQALDYGLDLKAYRIEDTERLAKAGQIDDRGGLVRVT